MSNYGKITLRAYLVRRSFRELAARGVAFDWVTVMATVDQKIADNDLDPDERKTVLEWEALMS